MLQFEILKELEPNAEILEIIKDYEYIVKNGRIKHLKATNIWENKNIYKFFSKLGVRKRTLTLQTYERVKSFKSFFTNLLYKTLKNSQE